MPLDAYGDFSYGVMDAPLADEPISAAVAEPSAPATSSAVSAPVQEPSPLAVASAPVPVPEERKPAGPGAEPAVDAASMPTPVEPSASDLDAMLAFGFGDGLSFTEVDD